MSSHTAATELAFLGKLVLEGEITCETGLHIGAGKGSLEIGGADNPVVKDAFGIPYVPGSSFADVCGHCWSRPPDLPFLPSLSTFRSVKGKRSEYIRASDPTMKSASCSDGIPVGWRK